MAQNSVLMEQAMGGKGRVESLARKEAAKERFAEIQNQGRERLAALGARAQNTFRSVGNGLGSLLNKAKKWGGESAAFVAAVPEHLVNAGDAITNKVDAVTEGVSNWTNKKVEQTKIVVASGAEMAASVGNATKTMAKEAIIAGIASAAGHYENVVTLGATALSAGALVWKQASQEVKKRRAENRLQKLQERIGKDTAELARIKSKHNLMNKVAGEALPA